MRFLSQVCLTPISKCVVRLLAIFFCLWIATTARAQDLQYAQDTVDQKKRSSLTVDPSSLGLNLQIPIAAYAGRAGDSLPIGLQYSSKVWHMEYGGNAGLNPHANGWVYPVFETRGGWSSSPEVPRLENTGMTRQFTVTGDPQAPFSLSNTYTYIIYRIQAHLPDGSTHELRKSDSAILASVNGQPPPNPPDPAGTYYAVDGSHLRLEYHVGVNQPPNLLYLPDGSRYIFSFDSNGYDLVSYVDRNGNTLVYSKASRQWSDTLGRVIALPLPDTPAVGDTTYTLPGIGNSSLTYILRWRQLADARTDPSQPLRYEAAYNQCDLQIASSHSPNLFGTGTSCDADDFTSQLFNPVLLSEVVLPNGQSYKFTYNVFGELDKIVYPTGGYERFQYDTVPTMSYVRNFYGQGNRGVIDHWISLDGSGTDEIDHHWHYAVSYPNNTPPYKVTATAPDGTYTERYLYSSQNRAPFKLEDVRVGRAYEERAYTAAGQMLRRTLTDWAVTGPMSGGQPSATRNPRITKEVDLILDTSSDALAKTTIYGYDSTYEFDVGIEQNAVNEYDYATVDQTTAQGGASSSITPGLLVRTTEKSYLDGDSSYRSRNLIGLITSTRVKDTAGNIIAQSAIGYDEASYPLLTYGSVSGWTDPQTSVRGNATTVSHWLNTTNTWLQAHAQFDQCGGVRNSWDARGNQSQIEYSSDYAYAYPTLARTPAPDPSGQNGSTTPLVSTTVFDFNTGLATSATDANNIPSTLEYNDPMIRPTRTVRASGNSAQSQSPVEYDDPNRIITGKSDLNAFNDNGLKSKTLYDGLGRTIETRTYESDNNYIAMQTQYDAMGRAYKVSSPFRPWKNETPVWTTSAFDALGRVIAVTTPDNASVTTSYSGNAVTVTDQAGKKRRSVTDALGRLIRVDEPDANGNLDVNGVPAQSTNYVYDALDNLLEVIQGTQPHRTFAYDSLKRLISAGNPESGTTCYGTVVNGQCQGNGYDANGNLVYKTDARGVLTTYVYDALNRVTSRSYSDGTPTVTYVYDLSSITNGKGRLASVSSSVSSYSYSGYDALGRALGGTQIIGSQSYNVGYTYDKAGHVLTETYPSGHAVGYSYDSAGRLGDNGSTLAFTGNLGDGVTRTYASITGANAYDAASRPQEEKFGTTTPVYDKRHYNVRGQLYDLRASTVPWQTDQWNWNRGAIVNWYDTTSGYPYQNPNSGTDNNGNVLRSEIYIPNDDQINSYSFMRQNYTYDSLNRLTSATELANGATQSFAQAYNYDRWGNRTINTQNNATWGNGINTAQSWIDPNTNRLYAPSDQNISDPNQRLIRYDAAGNQTTDNYSAYWNGTRTYDAENRMTTAINTSNQTDAYSYDGDGRRVKRSIAVSGQPSAVETWQVYGLGGELIAEYSANANASSPQKEYGYRNGQLLVTAEAPTAPRTNVALAANGTTASASSTYNGYSLAPGGAIDGEHKGSNYLSGGAWHSASNTFPQWLEIDFNGSQTVNEVDVFSCQDNYLNPSEPTQAMTFTLYGLSGYEVQYWNGSGWVTVTGGSITGSNQVWRKLSFASITTTKLRVLINASADGWSRIIELEAWGWDATSATANIHWLVSDQLGTLRMIFDQSGSLAKVSRHDYLPFGEELSSVVGLRASSQGYAANDGVRTLKERDNETGLDYFESGEWTFILKPLADLLRPKRSNPIQAKREHNAVFFSHADVESEVLHCNRATVPGVTHRCRRANQRTIAGERMLLKIKEQRGAAKQSFFAIAHENLRAPLRAPQRARLFAVGQSKPGQARHQIDGPRVIES